MKGIIAVLMLFVAQPVAYAETQDADTETLKEIYEYCFSLQEVDAVNDKTLLDCINEELEYGDFNKFASVKDVQAKIG